MHRWVSSVILNSGEKNNHHGGMCTHQRCPVQQVIPLFLLLGWRWHSNCCPLFSTHCLCAHQRREPCSGSLPSLDAAVVIVGEVSVIHLPKQRARWVGGRQQGLAGQLAGVTRHGRRTPCPISRWFLRAPMHTIYTLRCMGIYLCPWEKMDKCGGGTAKRRQGKLIVLSVCLALLFRHLLQIWVWGAFLRERWWRCKKSLACLFRR